jgi:four helix bundle suffix protein
MGKNEDRDGLIPKHGGYRHLKTFQLAELIYDVTVRFCNKYVDRRSRTHDQMVQAARSGQQNILEGSVDSATSKKIEMKLTGISKGSLAELQRDYEDFLRQRGLPQWEPAHPALTRFKALRCSTLEQFRVWVAKEVERAGAQDTDKHGPTQTKSLAAGAVRARPCRSVSPQRPVSPRDLPAVLAANGALSLLNLCIYLLDRQLRSLARTFEEEGGFTERLYKRRSQRRQERSN